MKTRFAIWLGLELLLAAAISSCTYIERREETRAVVAWLQNPSPETKAERERQRRITTRDHVWFAAILFGGMAGVTVPVIVLRSRKPNSKVSAQSQSTAS